MSAQASKSRKTARADTTGGPNEAITIPDDDPTPTNSINKRLKDGYKQRDALIRGNQNQGLGKALSRFEAATGVDAHFILPHMFACMSYLLAPGVVTRARIISSFTYLRSSPQLSRLPLISLRVKAQPVRVSMQTCKLALALVALVW